MQPLPQASKTTISVQHAATATFYPEKGLTGLTYDDAPGSHTQLGQFRWSFSVTRFDYKGA